MQRNEKSIEVMYGREDLAEASIFQGGFINFGYWPELPQKGAISAEDRVESSRQLYRETLRRLHIQASHSILEIGCGRGHGCALALREFHPAHVTGTDVSSQQIARAKRIHTQTLTTGRLTFLQAPAEAMSLRDGAIDRLYSVEAAQHFASVPKFLQEAFRVLKPGGAIAVTTFFAMDVRSLVPLAEALPTIRQGIDRIIPVAHFFSEASRCGFRDILQENIGDRVFDGFDRWMGQTEYRASWGRNWLKAFREGWLNYCLITAHKP